MMITMIFVMISIDRSIIMMIMIMRICHTQGAGSGRDWAGMITIFIG